MEDPSGQEPGESGRGVGDGHHRMGSSRAADRGTLHLGLPDELSRDLIFGRGGTLKGDLPAGATLSGEVTLKRGNDTGR